MNSILIRIAAAALVGAALSTTAAAQSVITGSGEDTTIVAPNPSGPVWGGALVRQLGSGEGAEIQVLQVQHTQPGHVATVIGSGEGNTVVYSDLPTSAPETPRAAPAPLRLAQR